VSFVAITLCVASEQVFIVVVAYFVIDSVRKLLDTPSYQIICYGYGVPAMILLRGLKGAMQLDHSKDLSVHVSTCISYDLNGLTSVVWKMWR
jgi:hypothetical protein